MNTKKDQQRNEFIRKNNIPADYREAIEDIWDMDRESFIKFMLIAWQSREYMEARIKRLETEVEYYKPAANFLNN